MVFTREAYQKIGGHMAVRQKVVEDKELTLLTVKQGIKWRLFDGTRILKCRMYRTSRESVEGLVKSLFPFFNSNLPFFVFVWVWLVVVFWQPVIVLALLAAGAPVAPVYIALASFSVGLSLVIWGLFYRRFGFPGYLTFLYGLTQIVVSSVALLSLVRNLKGTATWKGRILTR